MIFLVLLLVLVPITAQAASSYPTNYQMSAGTRVLNTASGIAGTVGNLKNFGAGTTSGTDNTNPAFLTEGESKNIKVSINGISTQHVLDFSLSAIDLSKNATFGWWVYLTNAADVQDLGLLVSQDAGFANYFSFSNSGFHEGWNFFQLHRTVASVGGGAPSWANAMNLIRLTVTTKATATQQVDAYIQGLYAGSFAGPQVVVVFDDDWASHYTVAYPYMAARGMVGNLALISSTLDTALRMTTANVNTMYAAGWDVINHTSTHMDLTTLGTVDAVIGQLTPSMDQMRQNGWTRALYHAATPFGATNATVKSAYAGLGFLSVRGTTSKPQHTSHGLPQGDRYDLWAFVGDNPATPTTFRTAWNVAKQSGGTFFVLFHNIVAGAVAGQTEIADFQAMMDILYRDNANVMRYSDWYNGVIGIRQKR